ncbi:MAG: hypothetical protein ACYC27_16640 [Armatimonadota bacterium]
MAIASLVIPVAVYILWIPVERLAPYPLYHVFSAVWLVLLPAGGLLGVMLGYRAIVQNYGCKSRGIWMAYSGIVVGIHLFILGLAIIWMLAAGGKS